MNLRFRLAIFASQFLALGLATATEDFSFKDNAYHGRGSCFQARADSQIKPGDGVWVFSPTEEPRKARVVTVLDEAEAEKTFGGRTEDDTNVIDSAWIDLAGCWKEGLRNYQLVSVTPGPTASEEIETLVVHNLPKKTRIGNPFSYTLENSKTERFLLKVDAKNKDLCLKKGNKRLVYGRYYPPTGSCSVVEAYLGAAIIRSGQIKSVEACKFVFNDEKLIRVVSYKMPAPGDRAPLTLENWWNEKSEQVWGYIDFGKSGPCRVVSSLRLPDGNHLAVRPVSSGITAETMKSFDYDKVFPPAKK